MLKTARNQKKENLFPLATDAIAIGCAASSQCDQTATCETPSNRITYNLKCIQATTSKHIKSREIELPIDRRFTHLHRDAIKRRKGKLKVW